MAVAWLAGGMWPQVVGTESYYNKWVQNRKEKHVIHKHWRSGNDNTIAGIMAGSVQEWVATNEAVIAVGTRQAGNMRHMGSRNIRQHCGLKREQEN